LVAFAPSCDAALERLTDLTIRANYALGGIGPPEADEAASLSRDVARALRRATPGVRRVVGMYRIGSWDPGDRWLPVGGGEITPRASLRA
jgi:hypothetical protein